MATLEVVLRNQQLLTAAEQSKKAIEGIGASAARTETSVSSAGRSMSAAFQATGGVIQLSGGVQQVARAFTEANVAAVALGSARFLLEAGKTAQDFREVASAAGGVAAGGSRIANAFSAVGNVLRANPLLAIASVLTAAATAMSLFGSATEAATRQLSAQDREIESLLERSKELDVRRRYGGGDPRETSGGALDALTRITLADRQQYSVRDLARLYGVSEQELRLAIDGPAGQYDPNKRNAFRKFGEAEGGYLSNDVSRDEAIRLGENVLTMRRSQEAARSRAPAVDQAPIVSGLASEDEIIGRVRDANRAEDLRQANEEMQQLIDGARQFGEYLGASLFDFLAGLRTGRDLVRGLAQDIGRQLLSRATANLVGSIAGSFAGSGTASPDA